MAKTQVMYQRWNPNNGHVAFVAIQTETNPPHVWRTYSRGDSLPTLDDGLVILPITAARNLFEFKEGHLEACVELEGRYSPGNIASRPYRGGC